MFRTGVIAVACLVVGFAAGLAAAPSLRPSPAAVPAVVAEAAGAGAEQAAERRAAQAPTRRNLPPIPRLALTPTQAGQAAQPAPTLTHAQEPAVPITLDQLPPALRAVVSQVAQGREIRALTMQKETHDGAAIVETEFEIDGMEHELHMDEKGKILGSEVEFPLNDVPTVISGGIRTIMPGAVLLEAERETVLDRAPFWEVKVQSDGRRYELKVAEDGRVLSTSPR